MAPVRSALESVDQILRPQGRVFFGWWIVLGGAGIYMLSSALLMQSYGAYVVLLHRDFGWSKTLLAGAFSMARIESGILGPLQGWLIDRFGPRAILRIGIVLFGLGFVAFSRVDSLLTFYLTFFLIALGSSLGGFVTVLLATNFTRGLVPALVLGAEGGGVRPSVAAACDLQVTVPLPGGFDSLNVSVAAGILLYEVQRQRITH